MQSIFLGVIVGLYAGNPNFRASMDATVKKAVGYGIDVLNDKSAIIDPPPDTIEDE